MSVHDWQATDNEYTRTITEEIRPAPKLQSRVGEANTEQYPHTRKLKSEMAGVASYSEQDTDPAPLRFGDGRSEGDEGQLLVWMADEIREVLDSQASPMPSGGDGRGAPRLSWPPMA